MKEKTKCALKHDKIRELQFNNDDLVHHPEEKKKQINKILEGKSKLKILECFGGMGNLTKEYEKYGVVWTIDKKKTKRKNHYVGDSFTIIHKLIGEKSKFHIVDIDSYGFPSRMFPHIFQLIDNGYLFVTFPIPSVNNLNGITQKHMELFYGNRNPIKEQVAMKIKEYGLMYWRLVELVDTISFDRIWRLCFKVNKGKATDICKVNNREVVIPGQQTLI